MLKTHIMTLVWFLVEMRFSYIWSVVRKYEGIGLYSYRWDSNHGFTWSMDGLCLTINELLKAIRKQTLES